MTDSSSPGLIKGKFAYDLGISRSGDEVVVSINHSGLITMGAVLPLEGARHAIMGLARLIDGHVYGEITLKHVPDYQSNDWLIVCLEIPGVGHIEMLTIGNGAWLASSITVYGINFDLGANGAIEESDLTRFLEAALDAIDHTTWRCTCKDQTCATLRQHAMRSVEGT